MAKHLAALGINVVGCARNLEKLTEVAQSIPSPGKGTASSGSFTPVQCDVRDETAVLNVFSLIKAKFGRLDICINNAGLAKTSPLTTGDTDDWRLMLEVNVLGLSIVARESVKLMTESAIAEGHIFNIGSMAGHRLPGSPETNFYSATKFAVRTLTEGLRRELRAEKRPIKVTLISPGIVETEFFARFTEDEEKSKLMFEKMKALQGPDIASVIEGALAMPPHVDINDVLIRPLDQVN